MASRHRIKDHFNEQRLFDTRMFIGTILVFALALLLLIKLVWLQLFRHGYYLDLSQGNRLRRDPIPASRGLILDRANKILVDNEPAFQLELVREQVPNLDNTLKRLRDLGLLAAEDMDKTRRQIKSRRSFEGVPIRLRMTDEEIGRFAVHRHEFTGVELRTRQTRHYPYGELGVHALGYVAAISEDDLKKIDRDAYAGTTLIGKLGVEQAFEQPLRGTNGFQQVLVNAAGRSVAGDAALGIQLSKQSPVAGEDLLLTIDLAAQQAAEAGLGDRRGAVVALDPANGDVLVLASRPGFDPALFGRGLTRTEYGELSNDEAKPLLNRALRGAYPSGSTIKPVMALAGLQYGEIKADVPFFCAGSFHIPGSSFPFREGKGGNHGSVDLRVAIARSCDVYFYRLAWQLGIDRIAEFLAPFGFGQPTGIEISGEKAGILPSQEWKRGYFKRPEQQAWFPGETVSIGVGQGYFSVTPLQLAHMASMLANRGISYPPRLVSGVRDEHGKIRHLEPKASRRVTGISAENWNVILDGMIGATTFGTAGGQFNGLPYKVAGKTGTAQVYSVSRSQKLKMSSNTALRDHSWFIAFAPADAPRIALCVLVENGGFGASAAAPIARKVIDAYLKSINLFPDPPKPPESPHDP
jgi:penicillin-binding protein 2